VQFAIGPSLNFYKEYRMGQSANSNRNADLDEKAEHNAGRRGRTGQHNALRDALADNQTPAHTKGEAGGAFGKSDTTARTNRRRDK
jgi:hypothetical protein